MKFITLKEAAAVSGYSADYIGQLIRAGKLEGKQVFSNVSWVTTEDAVQAYLQKNKKKGVEEPLRYKVKGWIAASEALTYAYRIVCWIAIGLCVIFIIVLIALVGISIDHRIERKALEKIQYAR